MRYLIVLLLLSSTALAEHYWRITNVHANDRREVTFTVEVYSGTKADYNAAVAAAADSATDDVEPPVPVYTKRHTVPPSYSRARILSVADGVARDYQAAQAARQAAIRDAQSDIDGADGNVR